MGLLDGSLAQLVREGTIARDEAALHADDPKAFAPGAAA
jgi:hypothetical protein